MLSKSSISLSWRWEVAVNFIGPWTLQVGDQKNRFTAWTTIDMVTNLGEVNHSNNETAAQVALHFEKNMVISLLKTNTFDISSKRRIHRLCFSKHVEKTP